MGLSPEIAVGLLSLAGTLFGTFGGIMTANKLSNYRIEQLERKVEKHNNLVERVFRLEDNDKLLEEKLDGIKEDVEDIKKRVNA